MKTQTVSNSAVGNENPRSLPDALEHAADSDPGALVGAIRSLRASTGDELNDEELTQLLHAEALPTEEGFSFLCISDGCVTLRVPRQEPATWYRQGGWLTVAKEEAARRIATKYGLHVYEPPDDTTHARPALGQTSELHHHLVLGNAMENIIVAHPRYLKIRLLCTDTSTRHLSDSKLNELLRPELLHDLSALYSG